MLARKFAATLEAAPGIRERKAEKRREIHEFAKILARTVSVMRPAEAPTAIDVGTKTAIRQLKALRKAAKTYQSAADGLSRNTLAALRDATSEHNARVGKTWRARDAQALALELELLDLAIERAEQVISTHPTETSRRGAKPGLVARRLATDAALAYFNLTGELPTRTNNFGRLLKGLFEAAGLTEKKFTSYVDAAAANAAKSLAKK